MEFGLKSISVHFEAKTSFHGRPIELVDPTHKNKQKSLFTEKPHADRTESQTDNILHAYSNALGLCCIVCSENI